MSFFIRQATFEDMPFFLDLAAKEGWNPGLSDISPLYSIDPEGFFIGEIDGKKIGCVSAVAYNDHYGFMGLYIVIPEYRHQGFGIQLWNHALAHLRNRTIGLDGVVEQQENYKKSGFELYYKMIRFEGLGGGSLPSDLKELKEIPFEKILEYDTSIYGIFRKRFLEKWLSMPNVKSFGVMEKNKLIGYGVMRPCIQGFMIGPLFADNSEVAHSIYQGLCSTVSNASPVFWNVPEANIYAERLAESYQCKSVFMTARMYLKKPPKQLLENIYSVATFEVG